MHKALSAIGALSLSACTIASEPPVVQAQAIPRCGYVGDQWQLDGVGWAAGHALGDLCACPRAKGVFGARVAISASGALESVELASRSGVDDADQCVSAAIEHAFLSYLAMQPGEYALPADTGDATPAREAAKGAEFATLSCSDASRYGPLPEALRGWRFAVRRVAKGRDVCHRPPAALVAAVSFEVP